MRNATLGFTLVSTLAIILCACAPQLPPTPAGPFLATFDDPGQWTQTSGRQADIAVQDGQLHITLKQSDTVAWSVAQLSLGDLTLEAEATPVEGPDDNGYGLIARRVDDDNFYSFQISGDGYFLIQKRVKATWVNLSGDWQASPAIHTGRATNRLRVVCQGSRLSFFANDTQLAQVTDAEFARGDIGVIAGSLSEEGVHVAFDNIAVTGGK